jgi:hypothetical protein
MTYLHGLLGAGALAAGVYGVGALLAPPAPVGRLFYRGSHVLSGGLLLAFAAGVWLLLKDPAATLAVELFGLCVLAMGLFPRPTACGTERCCGARLHEFCRLGGWLTGALAGGILAWRLWGGAPGSVLPACALALAGMGLALQAPLSGKEPALRPDWLERTQLAALLLAVAINAVLLLQR